MTHLLKALPRLDFAWGKIQKKTAFKYCEKRMKKTRKNGRQK